MLVKTIALKASGSITPLMRYLFRYVDQTKIKESDIVAQAHAKLLLQHGTRARTVNGLVKAFKHQESLRLFPKKNNTLLQHTIISYNALDNEQVTEEVLYQTAQKFTELRTKYGDTMIAVFAHLEKDHKHLHAVCSGVYDTGYSSILNNSMYAELKRDLQTWQLETFPKIQHSTVRHGLAKSITSEQLIEHIKTSRETNKKELLGVLENAYSKATSKEHFLSQLEELGHTPYIRGSTVGIEFNNKKYRLKRLGFDNEKLDTLDKTVKNERNESNVLHELQALREQAQNVERELTR